ncbi:hypothetical protein K413DRAFT_4734 [Clostridium sp. ASBs410]|nr:hypothetical protein K413DRAFT_4734 [Clostridium sp. ASBs410]
MIIIETDKNKVTSTSIQDQKLKDEKSLNDFYNGKSSSFDYSSLKRLVLAELSYNNSIKYNRICGFTRKQILNMIQSPERYGDYILRLSQYMMLKSGYYKRLIDYFANMGIVNWTVDTEVVDAKFFNVSEKTLRNNYIKFCNQCSLFRLETNITSILKKMFVEDVCYGFLEESDFDTSIFFIDPRYCEITKNVNGNVYQFAINRSLLTDNYIKSLPKSLQVLLEESTINLNNLVQVPYENSICLKYNNDVTYPYPPFFNLISDILLIDDYKDLAKAKTESDAYKLVYFKIPTNDDGKISMGDEIVVPFVEMTKDIIPETWGVVPSPMDLQLVESKSTVSDDTNKVQEAVDSYYGEAGVSKSLISSASSGSELKLSIKVDSSDMYRIYRMIENWMDLQLKLRGFIFEAYRFVYDILDITIYDSQDAIDKELKLAQVSVPNKMRLLATMGINPLKLLGNSVIENTIFKDVFEGWKPLQSSFTQGGSDKQGRPPKDETEISDVTDTQRNNDSNNTDNRI